MVIEKYQKYLTFSKLFKVLKKHILQTVLQINEGLNLSSMICKVYIKFIKGINLKFRRNIGSYKIIVIFFSIYHIKGLPHTQGIQGNSGNFQVEENLRETLGILIYFLNLGKF